jgi:hypothetical protein
LDGFEAGHASGIVAIAGQELVKDHVAVELVEVLGNKRDYVSEQRETVDLELTELGWLVALDRRGLRVGVNEH